MSFESTLTKPLSTSYSSFHPYEDVLDGLDDGLSEDGDDAAILGGIVAEEDLDAAQSQVSSPRLESSAWKTHVLMRLMIPALFLASTGISLYYKTEVYFFNQGDNGPATALCLLIGFCFESAMLCLMRLRDRPEQLRIFELFSILLFTRLSFAVGQGELNVDPYSEAYEGLYSTFFAAVGASFAPALFQMVRRGIPDQSREFMNDFLAYHPKKDCDLTPIILEPMTVKWVLINNVAVEILAGSSLMIASACIENFEDSYICLHTGAFLGGLGIGNGIEFGLTRIVRIIDSRGAEGRFMTALRISKWLAGEVSGLSWPATFAVSHDDPGLRLLAGVLVGVNNSSRKREMIETTPRLDPHASSLKSKKDLKSYFTDSTSVFYGLGVGSVLAMAGWFAYNIYISDPLAIQLSAGSAIAGLLGGFTAKALIDRAYDRRTADSLLLTSCKFYTSYCVVWWILPDMIVEQDIEQIYSRDITERSPALIAGDCLAYFSYGAGWGLTIATETLNPTFIYDSVKTIVYKTTATG